MTMLALAKKVYPNRPWVEVFGETVVEQYSPINGREAELFTPARNPAQLLDVLCWLLNTDPTAHWELTKDGKGTPQSFADAIFKAAVRVAGEEA